MKESYEISDEKKSVFATDMTLRDHYAGLAMQGLMDAAMPMPEIADAAYEMADAMLKARKK
jgi:hypothetical protein